MKLRAIKIGGSDYFWPTGIINDDLQWWRWRWYDKI